MTTLTAETRNESYYGVLVTLGDRQKAVASHLFDVQGDEGVTANELAKSMWNAGEIQSPERNNVHPRLNELVDMELVRVIDKKVCSVSGKKCGTYKTTFGVNK